MTTTHLVWKFRRLVLRFLHAARNAAVSKERALFAWRPTRVSEAPWRHDGIDELREPLGNCCRPEPKRIELVWWIVRYKRHGAAQQCEHSF